MIRPWLAILAAVLIGAGLLGGAWLLARETDTTAGKADTNANLITAIEREGRERRDQTCLLFERQELAEVNRLGRTYAYLSLPAGEREPSLTRAVIRGLAEQREDALAARAPAYCNERKGAPVIGLPEPGPEFPPERNFRNLLRP